MIFYSDVFVFHALTPSAQLVVLYHFRAVMKTSLAFNFHRPQINNNYGASSFSFIASKIWETIPLELEKLCYYRSYKQFKLYLLNAQSVS